MKHALTQTLLAFSIGGGLAFAAPASTELPLSQFVNPFIGTDPNPFIKEGYPWDTGNVFPGAVCPRGMLAWSPDTTHAKQIAGGYWYPDRIIEGFSLTHFSGRGVACLKDLPFMPSVQSPSGSPGTNWAQFAATFSHANESAAAGYYRVKLDNGIETELTTTLRSGMARFTFPAPSAATLLWRTDGEVTINGTTISGFYDGKIGGGKRDYRIYFAAEVDHPIQSAKTWQGDEIRDKHSAEGKSSGVILAFDTTATPVVQVRVGISYVSIESAQANLAVENPGWDFATVQKDASARWNATLNHIQVEGGTTEEKQTFYTALYHCFMHPNLLDDTDGRYIGMDERIHSVTAGHHQYQNIPAWDQHRSLSPLIAILTPAESSDIMQSLVNYAQQDASVRTNGGGLPRWQQVNRNSGGMVGDGDDTIIATSFAFGASQFDTKGALEAMDKGAAQPGTASDGFEVRSGLKHYESIGYVPGDAAVTLEYCNDDFALAQFASALGDRQKYVSYQNRAQNWKSIFDDATGLCRPRNAAGAWATNFSAVTAKGFVEGTSEQYVWMVNFNLAGLISKMGGSEKTVDRLDHFFTKLNGGVNSDTAFMGNEPCEEVPWIYDFAGAPARTQEVVRRIQKQLFTNLPNGLPGNDDAGALSSWYVFSALGLYPEIPGVAGFAVGSPLFTRATIHLENGRNIQITGKHAAPENYFVQKLTLNGNPYGGCWLPWTALSQGAALSFHLGSKASAWAEKSNPQPPSFDTISP